ncbi:histidine kinase [Lysinibacillus sp. 2017]|uniref:histidine kinase n=1 Tax=unclassified Lysinibacillus TaxID=2636778 RepID=UPI000D52822C|nr:MULTISPECIES: histidine kinase [unclassified Lysinibacillus]AWE07189.1 histidine kinase [Lysinibacillus sp. 2017]TGN34647.1 histidine kinase [Lysinibacillus sp. S2017]
MKKIIGFNLLFCLLVIVVCNYYYDSKSKQTIAYFHAENYIETNYNIDKENLKPGKIDYYRGLGLFGVEVVNTTTKTNYFFEVDISDDYSLLYIHTES